MPPRQPGSTGSKKSRSHHTVSRAQRAVDRQSELRRGRWTAVAQHRLVEANLQLVVGGEVVPQPRLSFLDLIQEGNLGLCGLSKNSTTRGLRLRLRHLVESTAIGRAIADQPGPCGYLCVHGRRRESRCASSAEPPPRNRPPASNRRGRPVPIDRRVREIPDQPGHHLAGATWAKTTGPATSWSRTWPAATPAAQGDAG